MFYFFWRGVAESNTSGWAWALIAGSVAAAVQFFRGPLIDPGGFGLSRWMSGFMDIVALPVLAPLFVYLLLFYLKIIAGNADFAGFTLLWLIPGAVARALTWSVQPDPILLVLVPVLWVAIAVGIPFFIAIMQDSPPSVAALSCLAILVVPAAAASSYWAFFSQRTIMGFLFLLAAAAPMLISATRSFLQTDSGR